MKNKLSRLIAIITQPQFIKTMSCIGVVLFILLTQVHAQTISDPGSEPDPEVPIDGGLSLLVAAGVGYGAKKMKERRAQKELL
jgi:FtsH-binding integral membrane protein